MPINSTGADYNDLINTPGGGGPPSGPAGGDLTGTYPNPTVHRIHGIDVQSTTPTEYDILAYGGSPAKWRHVKIPIINKIKITDGTAVTGTTLNTYTDSVLIPANTVAVGDVLNFKVRVRKTGTAGTTIIRVYFNTTGVIGGSLVASSTTAAATSLFVQMSRTFAVKTATNTESYPSGVGATIDEGVTGTAVTASNINWAVDQYLVIALQNSNNADNSRSSFVHLQINKNV